MRREMTRATPKDVELALARMGVRIDALGRHDVVEAFVLQAGSPSKGQAWRLFARSDDGGLGPVLGLSDGYLGWTAAEAEATLKNITRGLDFALDEARRGT
jgi:hypothetical protein